MSLEEEHQTLHRRGELIKFFTLVIILLLTVLVVAAIRPLIFGRIVPSVMGWQGEEQPALPLPTSTSTPDVVLPTATVTAPAGEGPTDSPSESPSENPSESPSPTATPAPTLTPQTHLVEPGDNLTKIAERYGVAVQDLIEANNLANPDQLAPGDRLIIP